MKRRNADLGKMRRPIKRNKITEGIYGSTLLYLKFLLLWVLVILADFILEFRFEFLWPFYLLIRSVYDSFKYQGLAFSVFFVCIALTSDLICFFFIPVHWLFFAASTYVWVQYVWHTDKGVCLPTIILWMLFVYLEAAIRLKDLRHMPFHMDLCRPFAAHCIGYPVVTLGFGFKSYVGYRMRQRRQRDVAKENEFYMQLLQQALPVETTTTVINTSSQTTNVATSTPMTDATTTTSHHNVAKHNHNHKERNGQIANGVVANGTSALQKINRKSVEKRVDHSTSNGNVSEPRAAIHTNGSLVGAAVPEEVVTPPSSLNSSSEQQQPQEVVTTSTSTSTTSTSTNTSSKSTGTSMSSSQGRRKDRHNARLDSERDSNKEHQEYIQRLENDVRRLRNDLQASRATETELRGQLASLSSSEKLIRSELCTLQREYEDLQSRLQASNSARSQDRQQLSNLERRIAEERRARNQLEAQLSSERKARKQEEAAVRAAQAAREREREREVREREQREREQREREAAQQQTVSQQCSEQCRMRRRELEQELQEARAAVRWADERCGAAERELSALAEQQHDADILMAALSAMQDKNQHLENSLSAETRIKLDLFSALGEAKRLLEIRESLIRSHEKEIEELKGKIAQVLAVMPSDSFGSGPAPSTTISRVRLAESPCPCPTVPPGSTLDPNATAYTPKGSLVAAASTEA